MQGEMMMPGIFIAGTGHYVPEKVVTNNDFTKFIETSDEWITERTGIRERRFSTGEPTWYMGKEAALAALDDAEIDAADIDAIICCTISGDFAYPSLACLIQSEVGAKNAFCFDISAACSGFVYALDAASRYLATGGAKNILIVCSEMLSRTLDFTDRSTCILLGDGAGAAVVQANNSGSFSSYLAADGDGGSSLYCRNPVNKSPFITEADKPEYKKFPETGNNYMFMAGRDVYRFAVQAFPAAIEKACEKAGISVNDIDLFVPHQANIRIIKTAAERLNVPMDKMVVNLDRYGNTSSASIPICLDELNRSGKLKRGMKIAIAGFGGGLTYGAAIFEW